MREYPHFKFWCNIVLPLVYDDSLSYYELLCKVVHYINDLIDQDKIFGQEITEIKAEIAEIEKALKGFDPNDTTAIEKLIAKYIATMIFVEINDDGYIVYNIPWSWDNITFKTTGLDYQLENYDYGRLVLLY